MKNSPHPTLHPLGKRVIIEYENRAKEKIGSFYVGKPQFQGVPIEGTVYAIGPKVSRVSIGQRVVFKEDSPRGFKHDGKKLISVDEEQILAVFTED